jgi:hypothetical protein
MQPCISNIPAPDDGAEPDADRLAAYALRLSASAAFRAIHANESDAPLAQYANETAYSVCVEGFGGYVGYAACDALCKAYERDDAQERAA